MSFPVENQGGHYNAAPWRRVTAARCNRRKTAATGGGYGKSNQWTIIAENYEANAHELIVTAWIVQADYIKMAVIQTLYQIKEYQNGQEYFYFVWRCQYWQNYYI